MEFPTQAVKKSLKRQKSCLKGMLQPASFDTFLSPPIQSDLQLKHSNQLFTLLPGDASQQTPLTCLFSAYLKESLQFSTDFLFQFSESPQIRLSCLPHAYSSVFFQILPWKNVLFIFNGFDFLDGEPHCGSLRIVCDLEQ